MIHHQKSLNLMWWRFNLSRLPASLVSAIEMIIGWVFFRVERVQILRDPLAISSLFMAYLVRSNWSHFTISIRVYRHLLPLFKCFFFWSGRIKILMTSFCRSWEIKTPVFFLFSCKLCLITVNGCWSLLECGNFAALVRVWASRDTTLSRDPVRLG